MPNHKWIKSYTLYFALIAGGVIALFAALGKSFIWSVDGIRQHYVTLSYISDTVRGAFAGEGLNLAALDFNLGPGLDSLTTLSFYGLTDPICYTAALFDQAHIETAYALTTFARIYLAGLAFGAFSAYVQKREGWATCAGALAYAFSAYIVFGGLRHPYFVNGAVYLPLMLLGAEKLMRERKPWLMIFTTALMLIVNFYFAYINTLLTVMYVIARLIWSVKKLGVKPAAKRGAGLLIAYLLGAAISCAVFLPMVYAFTQNGRAGVQAGYSDSLITYPLSYYKNLFTGAFKVTNSMGAWSITSYTPLAMFSVMYIFTRKGSALLKAAILTLGACLLVPFAGKLFNGMSYVTNRWCYALALAMSAACAQALPEIIKLKKKTLGAMALAGAVYAIASFAIKHDGAEDIITTALILAFCAALIFAPKLSERAARRVMPALMALSVMCFACVRLAPGMCNYISQFNDSPVIYEIERGHEARAAEIDDDEFFRVDTGVSDDSFSTILGYRPTSYFWSLIPATMYDYQRDLQIPTRPLAHHLNGLGARAALDTLAGVKYAVRPASIAPTGIESYEQMLAEDESVIVPWGFTYAYSLGDARVYENKHALGAGYAFSECLTTAAAKRLSAVELAQAYTEYAVVDAIPEGMAESEFVSNAYEIPFEIREQTDCDIASDHIYMKAGGSALIAYEAPDDHEVYIVIDAPKLATHMPEGYLTLITRSSSGASVASIIDPESNFAYTQLGVCVLLGAGGDTARIRSIDDFMLECASIKLCAYPMQEYERAMTELAGRRLTDAVYENNRITGNITLDKACVLQIAVPYSKGLSALVDGVPARVFLSGGMYAGIALAPGAHKVEILYETPYLRIGARISATALALTSLCALAAKLYKRARKKAARA